MSNPQLIIFTKFNTYRIQFTKKDETNFIQKRYAIQQLMREVKYNIQLFQVE